MYFLSIHKSLKIYIKISYISLMYILFINYINYIKCSGNLKIIYLYINKHNLNFLDETT